jgi:hypothetical protein
MVVQHIQKKMFTSVAMSTTMSRVIGAYKNKIFDKFDAMDRGKE